MVLTATAEAQKRRRIWASVTRVGTYVLLSAPLAALATLLWLSLWINFRIGFWTTVPLFPGVAAVGVYLNHASWDSGKSLLVMTALDSMYYFLVMLLLDWGVRAVRFRIVKTRDSGPPQAATPQENH